MKDQTKVVNYCISQNITKRSLL